MDNPLPLFFGFFCLGPLAIFALGFWVGKGLPGLPFRLRFERVERYDSPNPGRNRGRVAEEWQP